MYHSIMNRIEVTHETTISFRKSQHLEVELFTAWHLITSPSQNMHICMSGKKRGSNYAAPILNATIIRRTCTSKGPLSDFAGHMNNSAYVWGWVGWLVVVVVGG